MANNQVISVLAKTTFLLSAILLSLGTAAVVSVHLRLIDDSLFGVGAIVLGTFSGLASLLLLDRIGALQARRVAAATEIAEQISQGGTPDEIPDGDDDLIEALYRIHDHLQSRTDLAERIAAWDTSAHPDDLLEAAPHGGSTGPMTNKPVSAGRSHEEQPLLERSVEALHEALSAVASGDLTVDAEFYGAVSGDLAASFNAMVGNLRELVSRIKSITVNAGNSAAALGEATEQIVRGSETHAGRISKMSAALSGMASQIEEVSVNAALSALVASESLSNAQLGAKAVSDNINAMNSIRKQVRETAKRIKTLGERSQEIGQIVTLIDDLADRASLLSLNASLQSSGGGEAAAGFPAVAGEIERLAGRSNHLTRQISSLTQMIQAETNEVVASMEDTIREVVVGSKLANNAGLALVEIEQVSTRLAQLIHSIADSASHQAQSSEDISREMAGISEGTELVRLGSDRAAESGRHLAELANELISAASAFRLTEEAQPHEDAVGERNRVYAN